MANRAQFFSYLKLLSSALLLLPSIYVNDNRIWKIYCYVLANAFQRFLLQVVESKHNTDCHCGNLLYAAMQKQSILLQKAPFNFLKNTDGQVHSGAFSVVANSLRDRSVIKSCCLRAQLPFIIKGSRLDLMKKSNTVRLSEVKVTANENLEELSDEDDELCPVECVREFKTDEEFFKILQKAKRTNSLVVVDFYRTSCGSCKYIEQGFAKLCKGSGDQEGGVIFLKHNVIDEYDEQSEVAERLRIKAVPLFQFYKDGVLLEAFPTRDKDRVLAAIRKYTDPASQEF